MASKKKPKKMSGKEMTIPEREKAGICVFKQCRLPVTPGKIEMKINNSTRP